MGTIDTWVLFTWSNHLLWLRQYLVVFSDEELLEIQSGNKSIIHTPVWIYTYGVIPVGLFLQVVLLNN